MARPTKTEKRNQQINLKLTRRELEWLCARARRAGMRPFEYGRAQLLADRPAPAAPARVTTHLDPLFIAHLSRIGSNLNQIARRLNQFDLPAPDELAATLREIQEMIGNGAKHGA